jgi:chromosome segregation ATPase
LDSRLKELDHLKLKEFKFDTSLKLKEIDNESDIELLRDQLFTLESTVRDLTESLRIKSDDLSEEQDLTYSLKEMLSKLGEKEETTEDLLNQFKTERKELKYQLNLITAEVQEKSLNLNEQKIEIELLKEENNQLKVDANKRLKQFDSIQRELESEAESLKNKLESSSWDLRVQSENLHSTINVLTIEKENLSSKVEELNSQHEELNKKLSIKGFDESVMHQALFHIIRFVNSFESEFAEFELKFNKNFDLTIRNYDNRIVNIVSEFNNLIKYVESRNDNSGMLCHVYVHVFIYSIIF